MRTIKTLSAIVLATTMFSINNYAEVTLPSLFSDHMVVQQNQSIPVWGWAATGEQVTVAFGINTATTTAGADGTWRVTLKAVTSPGPAAMIITGNNRITINDVLAGEVWLASGQSNMAMMTKECQDAQHEIAAAHYPRIRIFIVDQQPSETPQLKCRGKWVVCSPTTAGDFTAVGYFFARILHQELNVPVGIINSSVCASPCEAWTKKEILQADPDFSKIFAAVEKAKADYPDYQRPANLYNGMILPLIPYAIRGVIWYQGEGNSERAWDYRRLFPAMIQNWRSQWEQGDFPFFFVQLASLGSYYPEKIPWVPEKEPPHQAPWAELREAQLLTLSLPNTGMALAIDLGDANDVHPTNKQDVAKRLALWAMAKTYGCDIVYSGPLYKSMHIEGKTIRIYFDHADDGLETRQANTAPANTLEGFAIAGVDQKFLWAQAKIDANTVVVWSDKIAEPAAVRYGWARYPICNLYNKAGLPASPFRTDTWPLSTQGK